MPQLPDKDCITLPNGDCIAKKCSLHDALAPVAVPAEPRHDEQIEMCNSDCPVCAAPLPLPPPKCTCGDIYGGFPTGEPQANQLDSTCPVHGMTILICSSCKHSLEDNSHGPDQNDFYMGDDGEFYSTGTCTYCKFCYGRPK